MSNDPLHSVPIRTRGLDVLVHGQRITDEQRRKLYAFLTGMSSDIPTRDLSRVPIGDHEPFQHEVEDAIRRQQVEVVQAFAVIGHLLDLGPETLAFRFGDRPVASLDLSDLRLEIHAHGAPPTIVTRPVAPEPEPMVEPAPMVTEPIAVEEPAA